MARTPRSLFCVFFLLAALALGLVTISAVAEAVRAHELLTPFRTFGLCAASVLYGAACLTSSRPRPNRNIPAIAGCLINIAIAFCLIKYVLNVDPLFAALNGVIIAASIWGIAIFARGEAVPVLSATATRRVRIPGDRTSLWLDTTAFIFFILATGATTEIWIRWSNDRGLPSTSVAVSLVYVVMATLTTLVVHESGHALIALACNMRILAFRVGPFQMHTRDGRRAFKIQSSGLFSGAVLAIPTNPHQPSWHEVYMIAAGPAASLCTFPVFLWAALHAQRYPWRPAWLYLALLASFAVITPLFNLIPFRTRTGNYSDGARILQILTNSPVLDRQRAIHRLLSTLVTPVRFRDLDPEIFQELALRSPNQRARIHLHLCAVTVFTDANRLTEARTALAAAEAIYNDGKIDISRSLHLSFIIDSAILNRDAATARLWWDRMEAKKQQPPNTSFWIARTALLWIEGQLSLAEHAWEQANTRAQKLPLFGAYVFDRSRVAFLRQMLDEAAEVTPTRALPKTSETMLPSPN